MGWWSKIASAFANDNTSSVRLDPREHIDHVVTTCGLTKARAEDTDFYVDAYEHKRLNPGDVRKFGHLLTAEEKAEIGLPAHVVIAREFLQTLNERGLADPEAAALRIARPAAHRCHVATSLLKMKQGGAELVRFRASPLAAGPCPRAAQQEGARMAIDKAAPLPFDDCSHPAQCGCQYQPWQNIGDDLGDMMV